MITPLQQGLASDVTRTTNAAPLVDTNQTSVETVQGNGEIVTLSEDSQQALTSSNDKTTAGHEAKSPISIHDLPPIEFFNQADVDAYDEHLMETLASLGIDTSQPIDFGFSYDGRVTVKNDHPNKEAIEAAFTEDMDLRNGLVQTSNFYMFQELMSLNEQWAEKLASGISEDVAGKWLVNAAKSATNKNAQGLSYAGGSSQDPFATQTNNTIASRAYGT